MGFHFYKYPKTFNFGDVKKGEKPTPISNVYIPSKNLSKMNPDKIPGWVNKVVKYAISRLETDNNEGEITAIHPDDIEE